MPEVATSAAPAAAAPPPTAEVKAAPPAVSSTTPPITETKTPETPALVQPQADDVQKALERKADALAKAKRESARIQAQREAFDKQRQAHAEDLKLAADWRRLDELKKKDPLGFLEAAGLKMGELSRSYLEKSQGKGKTPEQMVEEAVSKRMEAMRIEQQAQAQKAEEANAIKQREAVYAGTKTQLAALIAAGGDKYEVSALLGDEPVNMAFGLIEKYYAETKQVLDFGKALDAVEAKLEQRELTVVSKSKKVSTGLEKLRAEAAEAAKKLAEAEKAAGKKGASGTEARKSVETTEAVSPTSKPSTVRRLMPRDQKRIAMELVLQKQAAKDS